ncbi:hypothetical protein C9374_000645 [Naegleria lovaniensis]|uniref:SRR1-like domain-containing protein n=1 Tax=Naegleria lovaniensis TaxID=51637 RepID=A0AA88KPB8_NAELO|nr:uncharacterized protein C9374_000645 [Naegleria lovaniensis]KAG2388481.1 hypothetical protein C9374_000645 [Naegleria lovaniensis]
MSSEPPLNQEMVVNHHTTNTHESIMQEGGFTIVHSNSSSGRRLQAHHNNNNNKYSSITTNYAFSSSWKRKKKLNPNNNTSQFSSAMNHQDFVEFNPTKFEKALERVRESLSETICSMIEKYFHPHQSSQILQVICYGIGDFISDKIALSQFKVLLQILDHFKNKYNSQNVNQHDSLSNENHARSTSSITLKCYIYDPVFEIKMSTGDREHLYRYIKEKFGMEWIEKNEECKRRIDITTFVYMPHCAFSMYYNLLMENCDRLNHLILLSNQLAIRKEILKTIFSMDEKKELSLREDNIDSNSKIQKKKKKLDDTEKYFLNFVFNNTNIYFFNEQERPLTDIEIFEMSRSEIDRALNRESDVELIHKSKY